MRPGSDALARLDRALEHADYEMVCYAQVNDTWVGATRSSPPGREPIWTRGTFMFSHFTTSENRTVLIDIARRLRREEPLGREGGPPPLD